MNSPAEAGPDAAGETAGIPSETTIDAFYAGRFHLVQPKGRGFRAGLDALLLSASLLPTRRGRGVDLGSGAGAASFAAAVRCPELALTLVERDPEMAGLARRSLALAENAALAARLNVIEADVLSRRPAREAAGLFDGAFTTVLTNPPFYPLGSRGSPDPLRQAARTIPDRAFLGGWVCTAAALLEEGGLLAMIARPDSLPDILEASRNRLGDIRILPVHSHPDRRAIRILVQARKGSRAVLSLLPPAALLGADGVETAFGQAISIGAAIDLPGLW